MSRAHRRARAALLLAAAATATSAISGAGAGAAKPAGVLVSQVSIDPSVAAGEAWVVTDPVEPSTVMVVWLATRDSSDPANSLTPGYCGVASSRDGGTTWSRKKLPFRETTSPQPRSIGDEVPICGDPVAGVGPDGTLYAAAANVGSPSITQSVASYDHGWSWTEPSEVFGATQAVSAATANAGHRTPAIAMGRASMVVDPDTGDASVISQEDGGVEGRWLSVSSDRGRTWSTPRPVDPDIQSRTAGAHAAAGGRIGIVYTVDTTSPYYLTSPAPAVSCPTGRTSCTVFATTADKGQTWDRHVMPFEGGAPGAFTFASQIVAADPARTGRFAVLLTTAGARSMEVWVTEDSGAHWDPPLILTAPTGTTFDKPWIAYSYAKTGALGVVYRITHDGVTDVLARVSRNGGTAFGAEVALKTGIPADGSSLPGDDCACNLHLDASTLSATWSDASTGQRQIYYGRLDYTKL